MDAAIINKDIVHFEEGILCSLLRVEANEGVAEGVSCFPVTYDVTGGDFSKTGENYLQVLHHNKGNLIEVGFVFLSCSSLSH